LSNLTLKVEILKESNIVIFLWVIGLILIIYATINFWIRIPKIDEDINSIQNKIDSFDIDNILFDNSEQTVFLTWEILTVLQKMGYNESDLDYKKLGEHFSIFKVSSLIRLHSLKYDQAPNSELIEKWKKMNFDELENEKLKYMDLGTIRTKEFLNKNVLKNQKDNLLYLTLFFQITGLVLTQLGIILHFRHTIKQNRELIRQLRKDSNLSQ